jgi:uncharacterized protein YbgA (DUF1722 family)
VLKSGSPSCGLWRVRVYDDAATRGAPRRDGTGLFARALRDAFPLLPIEEEGRLRDVTLRETFLEAVFAYARLRERSRAGWTRGALVEFHTRNKLLVLAHSPEHYRRLGQLVGAAGGHSPQEAAASYGRLFMEGLSVRATRGRHANVLSHMAGYFRRLVSARARAELAAVIEDYRRGYVSRAAPVALVRHLVAEHEVGYLASQSYLAPLPREMGAHLA